MAPSAFPSDPCRHQNALSPPKGLPPHSYTLSMLLSLLLKSTPANASIHIMQAGLCSLDLRGSICTISDMC